MLEILVIVIGVGLALLAMAKKRPRRRSMGRYLRGNVNEELALSTLAGRTLVATTFDSTVNERTFVSSIVARWAMNNFTAALLDGPIMVGVAHGDYTDAEIEEWIETTGSWNEGDLVATREVGRRLVKQIGVFATNPADTGTGSTVLNDGKAIKSKLGWILNQGVTLKIWAYNLGTSALATTSPVVKAEGHVNLFPK